MKDAQSSNQISCPYSYGRVRKCMKMLEGRGNNISIGDTTSYLYIDVYIYMYIKHKRARDREGERDKERPKYNYVHISTF